MVSSIAVITITGLTATAGGSGAPIQAAATMATTAPTLNVAPYAEATASDAVGGTSASGINDTSPTTTKNDIGANWTAPGAGGTWAQLTWSRVQTLTTIQLVGAVGLESRILAGKLSFSDGSTLKVGQVITKTDFPTTLSFEPRTVTWVRFEPTTVGASGTVGLAEMRAYPVGSTPLRPTTENTTTLATDPTNPKCATAAPASPVPGKVYVLCPTTNTKVKGTRTITFVAPGLTRVVATVWSAAGRVGPIATVSVDSRGRGKAKLSFTKVATGPVTVELKGTRGARLADAKPTRLQLYNSSSVNAAAPAKTAMPGNGRTLVYDNEFNVATSVSLDGRSPTTDYPAAKPEWFGTGQFGSATFPDPAKNFDNLKIVDKQYLRLTTQPNPAGYTDPTGWKRKYIGGMLASARPGGSGFSAQYGYFEARMLVPGNPGTWPAFWMLPSTNLIAEEKEVAEIDAIEQYGHDPAMACHSTHYYKDRKDVSNTKCIRGFSSVQAASSWHTYGVDVMRDSITYYIDGEATVTVPQVGGGGDPMFFMVNLDLGGGWPIEMDTVNNRSAMYVDYVRVYV